MTAKPNWGGSSRRVTSTARRPVKQRGGVLGPAAVHADARVVDDHDGAVVHRLDADLDRGVGL